MKNQKKNLMIPNMQQTDFQIIHVMPYETRQVPSDPPPHIHQECEIYVNVSGDISFFCNEHIYPMTRGDILIARPGETHHCIYRSNASHEHYWILFNFEQNRHIWDCFFLAPFENVLRPEPSQKEELLDICRILNQENLSEGERFYYFFNLMTIIRNSHSVARADHLIPKDFIAVLNYINQHIHEKLTVSAIAEECFISTSTLERYFMKFTNSRPSEYIRYKKLIKGAELLRQGCSVSQTVEQLGYSDQSYFIELFKKYFGTTPLQYKKRR